MPPPRATRHVRVDAPNATEDTLAKTTSDIITIAVVCALKRAAPYCSVKFEAKNATLRLKTQGAHDERLALSAVTAGIRPHVVASMAQAVAISVPPPNMATMRDDSGVLCKRSSQILVSAKQKPASSAKTSARS